MPTDSHKHFEVQYQDGHDRWIGVWPKHSSFSAAKGTASRVKNSQFFVSRRGHALDRQIQIGAPPPPPTAVRIMDLRNNETVWEWYDA